MRLGLRELRRRFRKFVPTTAALALLVVLLLMLGGLLDGLYLGSTGALRSQESELAVYSDSARDSVIRSRIDPGTRATIESVDGVAATSGFGVALVGARVPGARDLADAAVIGYEGNVAGVPAPPAPGTAWADDSLEADGVRVGDTVKVGPTRIPLEVIGFVTDTNFLQQGALWVEPETWRAVLAESRPGAAVDDDVFQTVWVDIAPGADRSEVADAIDAATGTTKTLTRQEAVLAIPGIKEQRATFTQIIGVTFFVSALVVALFFALLTLERTAMLGVLKAVGASSRQLVTALGTQTVLVTALAYALGAALAFGFSLVIPPDVPITLTTSRAVYVAVGVFVAALIGGAVSLRRIVRIDPASAIGTGT
ncbi:MAG: ABC transporter permease [Actinomycetota bacterium]